VVSPLPDEVIVRRVTAEELGAADLAQLLDLFATCWPDGDFTSDDVDHAMGGVHWLAEAGGRVIAHASVVPRWFDVCGQRTLVGYVEAVCTHPAWQRRGVASRLMDSVNGHIRDGFDLGALSTGIAAVYRSNGWEHWRGPSFVRLATGPQPTPDEDGGILVLRTPRTPADLDVHGPIVCDWRAGDAW
jgi:aminoglycoside 2'-N-acetyltransferase I